MLSPYASYVLKIIILWHSCIVSLHVYLPCVYAVSLESRRRCSDTMKLELQMVLSHHTGDGNWTWILWKINKWSSPLGHLPSPTCYVLNVRTQSFSALSFGCFSYSCYEQTGFSFSYEGRIASHSALTVLGDFECSHFAYTMELCSLTHRIFPRCCVLCRYFHQCFITVIISLWRSFASLVTFIPK